MSVFETAVKKSSVPIAKDRLKLLLGSDRVNCTPDTYEKISRELYQTLSKYMQINQEEFDVQITNSRICITLTGEE